MRCHLGLPLGGRLRREPTRARDKGWVLGHPPVCVSERAVGLQLVGSFQNCCRTPAKEVRSAGALCLGEPIEPVDELVIQLDQYLTTSHEHMVEHMVGVVHRASACQPADP